MKTNVVFHTYIALKTEKKKIIRKKMNAKK